ncbi:MAG: DUF4834 domain-containing protein [Flavobacteriales bacterium]|jgi:bacteriorhodopsin|nr:DUF4834 domain-containing protein [Flavobacteriales bacterium]
MGLLRTLLVFLAIYYVLKFLSRYIFPFILKKAVSKVEKNMKEKYTQPQDSSKVGETTVEFAPEPTSHNNKVGEYVDFEEVDLKESKKD